VRVKLLSVLLILNFTIQAQNHFIVQASKDSLDGFMPFYDSDEKVIPVMISMDTSLKKENHIFEYAFQQKSETKDMLDIYNAKLNIPTTTFDYAIPINDTFINSGNYTLIFRLKEKSTQKLLQERSFNFQTLRAPNKFYNPSKSISQLITKRVEKADQQIDLSTTFVNKYDLHRIQQNINALVPIAEVAEQGGMNAISKNSNLDELRRFFYNFWYSRNPQNPEAEWKSYADKLNYCARKFAFGAFKGHQTDMGRIYLRFGPPNRMIKASNERGTRPYEIWFYTELDKHTNINILFGQMSGMANERVIIHSSDPAFYFNPNWPNILFTDPQERLNTNSHRVYDFFK
jgi:GWxTD domain-containing protein